MKKLLEMFLIFFKIGLFTIGGGYAMLPVMQREIVGGRGWMTDEEFLDAIALTNSLPGPMATNTATFVGYRCAGVRGAVVSILGAALPSVLIILLVATVFQQLMALPVVDDVFRGVRPAVVALVFYAVVTLGKSAQLAKYCNWLLALASFAAIAFFGVHPIIVVVCAALYGIFAQTRVIALLDGRAKR